MSRKILRGLVLAATLTLAISRGAVRQRRPGRPLPAPSADPGQAQVVLDWERILFSTVYPATPIPTGVPILGVTSMAMYDAAASAAHRGRSSETAAVATAAHDVLVHYFPSAVAKLDADLAASLATVQDTRARIKGSRLGREAAAAMLASRQGDGYGDPSIHYTVAPGVGVWQPNPGSTDMLAAWIGSLRPLLVDPHSPIDRTDPVDQRGVPRRLQRGASARERELGRAHAEPEGHRALLQLQLRHHGRRRVGPAPCLTAPQVQVIRETLGEDTALELRSVNFPLQPRVYTQLAHIEHEAFHARIWSGLHFRDAMVDAHVIGHDTASRVLEAMAGR